MRIERGVVGSEANLTLVIPVTRDNIEVGKKYLKRLLNYINLHESNRQQILERQIEAETVDSMPGNDMLPAYMAPKISWKHQEST